MNDATDSSRPRGDGAFESRISVESLKSWFRGFRRAKNDEGSLRESLEELIEEYDEAQTPVDTDKRVLLRNVLNLHTVTLFDVMVPRADIVAVEIETSLDDLVKLMSETAHSRLPIYKGSLDEVVGMVHIKDVLACWDKKEAFNISEILRDVLIVAPSMLVLDLLLKMRLTRVHMALVVDEFGGIDGLVSIEDLVEEIVGEIEDEHDADEGPRLVRRADGSLLADARADLDEFEQLVGAILNEEERDDIDTLGGLVFLLAGRVPGRGELVTHPSGLEFEVVDADPRRIKKLLIRNLPPVALEKE